jgi:hypothetical protein
MIYIILIAIIISCICDKQIYKICDELTKTKSNTIIIYTVMILSMVLIYQKYGITSQSIKYLSLIPFIIIISIIVGKGTAFLEAAIVKSNSVGKSSVYPGNENIGSPRTKINKIDKNIFLREEICFIKNP